MRFARPWASHSVAIGADQTASGRRSGTKDKRLGEEDETCDGFLGKRQDFILGESFEEHFARRHEFLPRLEGLSLKEKRELDHQDQHHDRFQ